ncbi:MAG: 2-hydroxyacyl-CoA dehydratase family protein [Pseudomonadales bacterium]|jgi:benzoyl-CoA reductase subunit B|nr:2-hydroxyacyl-CoA dehydratase family protein [Pseudomonadales bacterium]MDP6469710.1 2-hydroxyacyl-CoA dehydratase family protein [Pseudomonadales bacterium]MDP6828951.1 2-hydroxyacyl-CoA dehydratase family protein [Pseudomonadales bacterium]|tara:strand:- start:7950 stop:9245 length:1296 start_codon:yes stop_codon:yes gene_type:complete
MTNQTNPEDLVGRGNREGSKLFRQWFAELDETAQQGGQSAYVFVMGSFNEILKTFDLPVVFPEINSLQTAVRRVAHEYLSEAEDYGYSPDICGYVKADVAIQLRDGEHPMGRIPKPSLAVFTNACNTYIKWAEIWERMYQIPIVTIDVPGTREADGQTWRGDEDFENDRCYIEAQTKELIAVCERVTGKKFDIDKLREVLGYANDVSAYWARILELNKSRPSLFNALTDGTAYLGVANGFRGTRTGAEYFKRLVEEMEYKAKHGIGTLADEQYRLAIVGVPCYPIFRRFTELFTEWNGTFVASTYLWFASGGANRGFQYDLNKPLESLAEGILISVRDAMDSMFYQDRILADAIDEFALDGIIYHPIKSCRTTSTGLADSRRYLAVKRDIPSLYIESDMMDRRVVSEAQLKNRIDAFFEGLASRRQKASIS